MFGLVAFIEQKENDNSYNLCKIHGDLYIASALMKTTKNDVIVKRMQQTLVQHAKATLKPLRSGFEQLYVYFVFKLYIKTPLLVINSSEFEVCLNKAGDHTQRKRSQKENRKPVQSNEIRLLLFDKCKFTKPLKLKKCWTRQTTHWSHIYQI